MSIGSIERNITFWNSAYDWRDAGEEWSQAWGGSAMLWERTIHPRIRPFLPRAGTIVELAPGFGRWTGYLLPYARSLHLIDLAPKCIEACRIRFGDEGRIQYTVNDGRSLPGVPDGSVDFLFTFDSLVHAGFDALTGYAEELQRVLAPDGVAFLHHSTAGEHRLFYTVVRALPSRARRRLAGYLDFQHGRALDVTAAGFCALLQRCGLQVFVQERINWGTRRCIDCFTFVCRPGSRFAQPTIVVENPHFMSEAESARAGAPAFASGAGRVQSSNSR